MPQQRDAISLLKEDHEKVEGLLEKLTETSEKSVKTRESLLAQIEQELQAHSRVEEEIFYPAFRDTVASEEDMHLFHESIEEHHVVDLVLAELKKTEAGSAKFAAKATVLKELVLHHAKEEEKEMFPKCKKTMSKDELQELGEQLAARKQELKGATAKR